MHRFKQKRYWFLLTLLTLIITANSCITLRKSDKSVIKSFKKVNQTVQIYRTNFNGKSMRYIADKAFDKKLPTVIFVHGAPGSSDNFYKHLQDKDLKEKANLITVDRLGYGYSDFGHSETSISKQAASIEFIAQKYKDTKIVLVGWSYGGPIIGKMAIENKNYAHIIMIAPAMSPYNEKYFGIGKLAKWKATKWFVPSAFVVAEDEKLAHANELKLLENDWQKITTPITYYHGDKDGLVPYENMRFFQDKMTDSLLKCVTIKDGGHFIPFKEYEMIKKELLEILEKL
jgi:pimeloyl-ACP methyl ester carboxylesterase